jgi:hypothetical protein
MKKCWKRELEGSLAEWELEDDGSLYIEMEKLREELK